MTIYRVAIIGLGGMGNNHALAVQAEDDCQLVGGAEVDVGRACSWKERFKVDAVFDSYEKMFDQLEPDIVINATQSPLHYAPTLAAARRGIQQQIAIMLSSAKIIDGQDRIGPAPTGGCVAGIALIMIDHQQAAAARPARCQRAAEYKRGAWAGLV